MFGDGLDRFDRWLHVNPDCSPVYPATLAGLNVSLGTFCLAVGTTLAGVLLLGLAGLVLATLVMPPSRRESASSPR